MSLSSGWPRRFENQQSNKLISSDTAAGPLGPQTHHRGFFFISSKPLFTQWRLTEHSGVFTHFHWVSPWSCPVQTTFYWWPLSSSTGAIWVLSISLKASSVTDNERKKWFFTFTTLLLGFPRSQGIWSGDIGVEILLRWTLKVQRLKLEV